MVIVITTLDLDSSNHENDQGVGLILRPCQFAIVLPIGNTNIDIIYSLRSRGRVRSLPVCHDPVSPGGYRALPAA